MSRDAVFTEADRRALARRGVAEREALEQLQRMATSPVFADLVRPCAPGDGIERLGEGPSTPLDEAHGRAARTGRVSLFVPASGAATRMFRELQAALSAPGPLMPGAVRADAARGEVGPATLAAFVEALPGFAFHDSLAAALAVRGESLESLRERGPWRPLVEALLSPDGLDYARLPKGLLAFHRGPAGARTPFEEHLEDAAVLARDAGDRSRAHFTVSPEHRVRFEALASVLVPALVARTGARTQVEFSEQHPATDTLAADPAGGPFRDAEGGLLFRPAGHGALLRNLAEAEGDLVFVRNVDNVAVARLRPEVLRWSRALVGLAASLRERVSRLLARLADAGDAAATGDATAFLRETLHDATPLTAREALLARLDRPLRVCGMVPNTGEPGGGPFWVRGADGTVSRQIVESAQVDPASSAQQRVFARATHFNPVFFACSLRDAAGKVYPLEDYVDPATAIVTRKSAGGRELLALERPGLWNGAMAGWNTVFVEVPLVVFNPVKSVLDLLRPEHQP